MIAWAVLLFSADQMPRQRSWQCKELRATLCVCVFFLQTQCQDTEDDDESNSDDPEAEQDEMLVEYAGEIVPNLGKAMAPDDFTQYFSLLLPLFLTRMVRLCFICCRNYTYSDADKYLAWPTSWYILFGGENISFDASLVIYI